MPALISPSTGCRCWLGNPRSARPARRRSAPSSLFAWIVASMPRCPVFRASRRVRASAPRTSPTMIRSGRCRRIAFSRSPNVIGLWCVSSWASTEMTCGFRMASSAVSSMIRMRSSSGMELARMFMSVVLPVPVPPDIRILSPRRTASWSLAAASGVMDSPYT
jgi:hypothetical protein